MSEFISRHDLSIWHHKSYEMRGKLKELGCQWDGISRAWVAPSIEVKELCLEILDKADEADKFQRPWFGDDWEIDGSIFEESISIIEPIPGVKSVAHTPSKEEAIKIVGAENVIRYWHEEIPQEASAILASGENNNNAIYERLEDAGWRSRQVSLLLDVVRHFREHPPQFIADEISDSIPLLSQDAVDPIEMDGSISVICDREKNPIAIAVKFPYNPKFVNMIKWLPGRRWNPSKSRWEVPVDAKHGASTVFSMFPHFARSDKAKEIEEGLK